MGVQVGLHLPDIVAHQPASEEPAWVRDLGRKAEELEQELRWRRERRQQDLEADLTATGRRGCRGRGGGRRDGPLPSAGEHACEGEEDDDGGACAPASRRGASGTYPLTPGRNEPPGAVLVHLRRRLGPKDQRLRQRAASTRRVVNGA